MVLFDLHTHNRACNPSTLAIQYVNPEKLADHRKLPAPFSSGIHPWFLTSENLSVQLRTVSCISSFPSCYAIGESGLDRICNTPFALQLQAFRAMVLLSETEKKPLIIHCVKAFDELLSIRKETNPIQPWIIHGFRGNPIQAKQLIEKGIFLSLGTRFNTETARSLPSGFFLLETDDEAQDISLLYHQIADIRG
ncbi:MAG: TatD family hydrolase, partial [Bacteroidales bacterium]